MNALEYLKQLPAVWINLDRSPDRSDQFERLTAPLFYAAYRVRAWDGTSHYDPDVAAFQWRDAITATLRNDPRGLLEKVDNFQAGDKYLRSQPKIRTLYACTMAVFYSHLSAIQVGYDTGWERFVVLEDDAVPRTHALSRLSAPPASSEITVWGGAIPMAGHKSDDRMFQEGRTLSWEKLPDGKKLDKLYCATAYEITRKAAECFLTEVQSRPLPFDIAWWYPMDILGGHRLVPTGFVQTGISERSGSTRRLGATSTDVKTGA